MSIHKRTLTYTHAHAHKQQEVAAEVLQQLETVLHSGPASCLPRLAAEAGAPRPSWPDAWPCQAYPAGYDDSG